MVQYSTPFIFLFIVDAFRAFDPSLEESSRMSGASRWQTMRRITLVLLAADHDQRLHPLVHTRHRGVRVATDLRASRPTSTC